MTALTFDLNEIVPIPDVGRIYRASFRPGVHDSAPSGRIRMDALARWVQDVAYWDVDDADVTEQSLWVVRRMRIRVERFPRFGDHVDALTFCSGAGRLWAERRVTFTSENGKVDVAGVWVHLSPQTRLPTPMPESFDRLYAQSALGRRVKARLRHPNPPAEVGSPWLFRVTDADVAEHVNNAAYWEPLEEQLGDHEALDAEIEFREPAQPGPAQVVRDDGIVWVTALDGRVHASIVFG